MNKLTKAFCWTVLRLEYIPAYRKLYTLYPEPDDEYIEFSAKPKWTWMRHGCWGINLLDRMNLAWKYIDATNPPDQKLDEEYYDDNA